MSSSQTAGVRSGSRLSAPKKKEKNGLLAELAGHSPPQYIVGQSKLFESHSLQSCLRGANDVRVVTMAIGQDRLAG